MTHEVLFGALVLLLLLQVTFSLLASAGWIPSSAALDSLLCAGSGSGSQLESGTTFTVEPVPITVVAGMYTAF